MPQTTEEIKKSDYLAEAALRTVFIQLVEETLSLTGQMGILSEQAERQEVRDVAKRAKAMRERIAAVITEELIRAGS